MKNYTYFDIAATTPIDSNVLEIMNEVNSNFFGNPSSVHQAGQKSHNLIEKSRRTMADLLGCLPSEIIFTSGGTESNNIALNGILKSGDHFITTSYEHPSILNTAKEIEKRGIDVTYLKPNSEGIITVEELRAKIRENTKLVSIMSLNNELGTLNPIENLSEVCGEFEVCFHTDAVQQIGKRKLGLAETNINLLSIAAHKFYGPKGVGALFIKKGVTLNPIFFGGGQESGYRPGTESVALIAGMTEALKIAMLNLNSNEEHIRKMEKEFFSKINQTSINYRINGGSRLHGFLNITFHDIEGQTLLMNLDMFGFAISFGSACSSGSNKPSNALLEIGMNETDAKKSVRISIGKFIQTENINLLVNAINKIITNHLKKDFNG